jgi:hypothetical protein
MKQLRNGGNNFKFDGGELYKKLLSHLNFHLDQTILMTALNKRVRFYGIILSQQVILHKYATVISAEHHSNYGKDKRKS